MKQLFTAAAEELSKSEDGVATGPDVETTIIRKQEVDLMLYVDGKPLTKEQAWKHMVNQLDDFHADCAASGTHFGHVRH